MVSFIKLIFFMILISISISIKIEKLSYIYFLHQNSQEKIVGGNTVTMINITNFEGNEICVRFEIKNNKTNIDTLYYRYDNSGFPINDFLASYSAKINKSYIYNDEDSNDYYSVYIFVIKIKITFKYLTIVNPDYHNYMYINTKCNYDKDYGKDENSISNLLISVALFSFGPILFIIFLFVYFRNKRLKAESNEVDNLKDTPTSSEPLYTYPEKSQQNN